MSRNTNTRPIGSRFLCNDVLIEVVENTRGCDGWCGGIEEDCNFSRKGDYGCNKVDFVGVGRCSSFDRSDGKDVYFKEVKS